MKPKLERSNVAIIVAIIGAIGLILANVLPPLELGNETFLYSVKVEDQLDQTSLQNIEVNLQLPGIPPIPAITDSKGVAFLELDEKFIGETSWISINVLGYERFSAYVTITKDELPYTIQLVAE